MLVVWVDEQSWVEGQFCLLQAQRGEGEEEEVEAEGEDGP